MSLFLRRFQFTQIPTSNFLCPIFILRSFIYECASIQIFLCGNVPMPLPYLTVIRQYIISIYVQTSLTDGANFHIAIHFSLRGRGSLVSYYMALLIIFCCLFTLRPRAAAKLSTNSSGTSDGPGCVKHCFAGH